MEPTNPASAIQPPAMDPLPQPPGDESVKVSSSELIPKSPSKLKPVLIILLILLILAGIGAYLYLSKPKETAMVTEAPQVQPASLFLTLHSPKDDVTAVNGEVLVSGKTLPNTPVVIYSDLDDTSVDSDQNGNFEDTILVGESGGLVRVTVYGENGDEQSTTVEVAQSKPVSAAESNVLGKSDSAPGQQKKDNVISASEEGNPKNNKNITGTLKNPADKNTVKPTPDAKTKKLIDDFLTNKTIVKKTEKVGLAKLKTAIGTEGTGSAKLKGLTLKKLLAKTATPGATLKRHALEGVITYIADGMITIAHQIQTDRVYTVYFNDSTVFAMKGVPDASSENLKIGMRIAAVGEPVSGGLLAGRIHIIPGRAKGIFEKNPPASPSGTSAVTPSPVASVSGTPTIVVSPSIVITPPVTLTPTESPDISPAITP